MIRFVLLNFFVCQFCKVLNFVVIVVTVAVVVAIESVAEKIDLWWLFSTEILTDERRQWAKRS